MNPVTPSELGKRILDLLGIGEGEAIIDLSKLRDDGCLLVRRADKT